MSQPPHWEHGPLLYLRSSLIVVRYERERYALIHPGSSSFTATDWLGARAARLLLRGHSDAEVARRVERRVAGAGERLQAITKRLVSIGAASDAAPARTLRWRARVFGALVIGLLLSAFSALVRVAPLWALHALYEALPETPLGKRTLGQSMAWMDGNLRASGFAGEPAERRAEIARESGAVSTRLYFFIYLCALLPAERFKRFLPRVIDVAEFEVMWRHVARDGAVIAGVHSDLFFGVPIYLRARGMPVACVADLFGLGIALASDADIRRTFPPLFPDMIDSRGSMTGKDLLTRLRGREAIMVAFDAPPQREALGGAMPTVAFLAHSVRRFDGAAWMAVRSGKPLIFVGTYRRGKRTVPQVTLLQPDTARPVRERVAALTTHLYALGEMFIRAHPESWMVWSYFHELGHELGACGVGETGKHDAGGAAPTVNTPGMVAYAAEE